MAANLRKLPGGTAAGNVRPSRGSGLLAILAALVAPGIAAAESLPDPTRPPAEISAPPALAGQAAAPVNRLQSIIISPTRRAAIISGQTVELGAMHGDARLVEVRENGVTLQGAEGRQVLALFPDVEIRKNAVLPPGENNIKKKKPVKKPVSKIEKEERK